jgi:hypothetical protein
VGKRAPVTQKMPPSLSQIAHHLKSLNKVGVNMQAIEFKNESLDSLIKVPERYKDYFGKPVTVILLEQNLLQHQITSPIIPDGTMGVLMSAVAKWYELGLISQGKGAEIMGISREEFMLALSRLQVSPFQYTAKELEEELQNAS